MLLHTTNGHSLAYARSVQNKRFTSSSCHTPAYATVNHPSTMLFDFTFRVPLPLSFRNPFAAHDPPPPETPNQSRPRPIHPQDRLAPPCSDQDSQSSSSHKRSRGWQPVEAPAASACVNKTVSVGRVDSGIHDRRHHPERDVCVEDEGEPLPNLDPVSQIVLGFRSPNRAFVMGENSEVAG